MPGPFWPRTMAVFPVERVYPSHIMPPLHSCATSQNVMPAFGKRSEIGMKADPMMPKACSMPCICKTFTKASSVVIFIALVLCNLGFTDFVLKDFSELTCGITKRGQVSPRCLHAHARFWCLDREGSEHLAVPARHRHRRANDTDEIFLAVERHLLLTDLPQFRSKPYAVSDGAVGEAPQLQALQQSPASCRRSQRQIKLADGAAMQWHARADAVMQPQGPMFCFYAIEIDDLAIEYCADIAGLVERMDEPLEHNVWCVVAHRG